MTTVAPKPPTPEPARGIPGDARKRYELLEDCREVLISRLSGVVGKALDAMGEDLAAAGKSKDSDERVVLAEAISQVRVNRAQIEERFRRSFSEIFERRLFDKGDPVADPAEPRELSLVDDEVVSQRIELDRRVNRTSGVLDPDEVLGIRARLAALLERDWFDEGKHPASPEAVFEALGAALADLATSTEVRTALLDAFEPHVSANLNQVYVTVNERLKARQVLPKIRPQVTVSRSGRRPGDGRDERVDGGYGPGGDSGGYWGGGAVGQPGGYGQSGGATHGAGTGSGQGHGSAGGGPGQGSAGGGPGQGGRYRGQPSAQDVHAVLMQLSQGSAAARASATRMLSDPNTFAVEELPIPSPDAPLLEALTSLQGSSASALPVAADLLADLVSRTRDKGSPLDQLTVEIVSMVFDYIYADKRIASVVKQQLLRLQVVAVKAALIDRSFFARRQHPMRRLIDRISEFASDPENDFSPSAPLVAGLESVVESVLLNFEQDLAIFDEARARIDVLATEESARAAERIAQVTIDAQRAEEVTQASAHARSRLADRVDPDTPAFVREFLDEWWSLALAHAHVGAAPSGQAGGEAQQPAAGTPLVLGFDEGLAVAESLIWSVAPKFPEDVTRLAGLLPRLINGLMRGTRQAGMPDDRREAFLDALMKTHTHAIGTARHNAAASARRPSNLRMRADGRVQFTPMDNAQQPAASDPAEFMAEERFGLPVGLKRGDFIEIDTGDGELRPFKLSWISPAQKLYVLSRFPEEAQSLERARLAELFTSGRARLVGERSTVQEAIESISVANGPQSRPAPLAPS